MEYRLAEARAPRDASLPATILRSDEKFLLSGLLQPDERVAAVLRWGGEPYRVTWVATNRRLVFVERQSRVYRVDDVFYQHVTDVATFHEPGGSRIRLRARGLRYGLDGLPREAVEGFEQALERRLGPAALRSA
ncbi:MAG: PH domain-containing protein [Gemmatimonadales bacterium]|jgi:hypothetical protein|nr:PH domain-containing protein [Gemmatimonadales bacterium]